MNTTLRLFLVMAFHSLVALMQAQGPDKPHTLFGDSAQVSGGYFALSARYTNVFDTDALLLGFSGAVVIDHKLNIGLTGSWSSSVVKNPAYKAHLQAQDSTAELTGLELRYGYGGILVEPLILHRSMVHLAFPVVLGVGGVNYSFPAPNGNNSQRERTDGQAFFVVEPGVEVELSIIHSLRIGIGGSYLWTSDLDLPGTPADALRTAMARMTLKFGQF